MGCYGKRHKAKLLELRKQYKNCVAVLQRKIIATKIDLDKAQNNIESLVLSECKDIRSKVSALESIRVSSDFAGAIAEMELIERLKALPDN